MARRPAPPRLHLLSDQRATAVFYEQAVRWMVSVKITSRFFDLGGFDKDPDRIINLATSTGDVKRDFFLVLFDGEEPAYFDDRKARARQIRDCFHRCGVGEGQVASWVVMPTTEALYLTTPELRDIVSKHPRRRPARLAELEALGRTIRHAAPDKRRVEKAVLSGTDKSALAAAAAACVAQHGLPDDIPCINAIRASLLAWSGRT